MIKNKSSGASWSEIMDLRNDAPLVPFSYPVMNDIREILFKEHEEGMRVLHFGHGKNLLPSNIYWRGVEIDDKIKTHYSDLRQVESKFDIFFSEACIEHLDVEEIKKVFKWARKNTKKIIFNVPNAWASYGHYASDYTHRTHLSHRAYHGLLVEAGYSKIRFYRLGSKKLSRMRSIFSSWISLDYCPMIGVVGE